MAFENMVTYAQKNFLSFEEEPINEVDSLIFCWLAYLNIHQEEANGFSKEGMSIRDLLKAEYFEDMFNRTWSPKETFDLLVAVVSSPRFRDIRIHYYCDERDDKVNLQFSAVVFSISEKCHYVAYRGTDWSITGWKEDLLLAVLEPVGAQKMAITYLNHVGQALDGELVVGGHSKGGNLAVYACLHCDDEICDRISAIYSHDGPGFLKEQLEIDRYARIKDRIFKTIPGASYFGMLFESEAEPKVIRSNGASVMQHDAITWEVEDHHLFETKARTLVSAAAVHNLNKWMNKLDDDQRYFLILAIFDFLDDLDIEHIDEIKLTNLPTLLNNMKNSLKTMDKENRDFLLKALQILLFGTKVSELQKSKEASDSKEHALTENPGKEEILAEQNAAEEDIEAFEQDFEAFLSRKEI